jgi:hypothetical protein
MYEIYKIEENGTKTLIDNTDINMGAVGVVYNVLESKATATLEKYVDNGSIKSEDKAMMIANVINNIINQSMNSIALGKDIAIKELQRLLQVRTLALRVESARLDKQSKEQKYISDQLKNGGIKYDYIFYKAYFNNDGNKVETEYFTGDDVDTITVGEDTFDLIEDYGRVKTKTLSDGTGLSTIELSNLKLLNDIEQLVRSVNFNNFIKGNEQLGDVIKNIFLSSKTPTESGLTAFISNINELTKSNLTSSDLGAS